MKDKKVVITGGAGFIGSNLADELAAANRVDIFDDLSTGRKENIAHLLQQDNIKFIQGSILDLKLLQDSFRGADFVFHQAALPSVPRSIEDPKTSNEVNITGTLNVLLAARDNRVKKVVFASSSSVYGDTPTLPKSEDMHPNPQSPYALTKMVGEHYCRIFQQLYKLPTVCLRYFNVYGPRQDPGSQYAAVIPRFIARVARGNQPVIYGDGEQTRDFTYVKDVVQANLVAAVSDATGIFNVGRGERNSINRLAEIVISAMGKDLQPLYEPSLPGDVKHSLADISRAKDIGYSPEYDLETGLKQTIESCLAGL